MMWDIEVNQRKQYVELSIYTDFTLLAISSRALTDYS